MDNNLSKNIHLLNRFGFGMNFEEYQKATKKSPSQVIHSLFEEANKTREIPLGSDVKSLIREAFKNKDLKSQRIKIQKEARQLTFKYAADWIRDMSSTHNPLPERVALFWHGHFACSIKSPQLMLQYLNLLRTQGLGDFKSLVLGVAKSPAMIRYLNNQQNRKNAPNENFARELLELFTIGRGHYTEKDIKEAARAFTGWTSTPKGEFVFRERHHDFGRKTFMGKSGNFGGEDIIDIVLEKPATAHFIARKIYTYFVNESPNETHIKALGDYFYNENYNITSLLRKIMDSSWFYDSKNIGSKIKSPIDYITSLTKHLDMTFPDDKNIFFLQKALGQVLFDPPNVAGWAGGKTWIDNATLMLRLNLPLVIMLSQEVNIRSRADLSEATKGTSMKKIQANYNISTIKNAYKKLAPNESLAAIQAFLLSKKPSLDTSIFTDTARNPPSIDLLEMMIIKTLSLPEYQLC